MGVSVFRILKLTFQRFNSDRCWNSAIVISYFALLCAVPLVALFTYVTAKVLGNSEIAFRSLNVFSEEFFAQLDPSFFSRLQDVAKNLSNLGWISLGGSFVAASFLFSNLIYSINFIFKAHYQKSFFYNRLMEYLIMFTMGIIMVFSLAITAIWTAFHRTIEASAFGAQFLNPRAMILVDNFLLQYLLPFTLTFLVFFSLYKFIPEVKVHTRSAALAAVIAAVLWEIFKRGFAFYVVNLSVIGMVLSKLLQGTLTSIIFFLLWISFSLVILLWGAELASVLNDRLDGKLHEHST